MAFDPSSISSGQINDLRAAAEKAWGDDTRNESFIGHPCSAHGQCFVTSQWLKNRLGGFVGTKDGHHFWVSPDKSHVLDLTGDLFAHPPVDPSVEGQQLDEDDEPWTLDPHHKTWRAGPAMYKRADHPVWKGFRVLEDHSEHPRAKLFSQRADAALKGDKLSSVKHADLMGADPYPGETPEKVDQMNLLPMHDEPDYGPDMSDGEYKFVWANGQIHVSPMHSHEDLASHAGVTHDSTDPMAVGHVQVHKGHALWSVSSNIALRGMHEILKDYSDTVGWHFEGMTDPNGEILHEDFGPKKSMYYTVRKDGHLVLSKSPLPHGKRLIIEGKTALVPFEAGETREAIKQWADDFGYKLAEYPGGGNMLDKMKPQEHLDIYNRGNPERQPIKNNPDLDLNGQVMTCGKCGAKFDRIEELRVHHKDHEPMDDVIEDGHFPQIQDFDIPLGFGTHGVPNSGGNIAKTAVLVLPSYKTAARFPRFDLYSSLFNYARDEDIRFYGAYRGGQMVGYGAVRHAEPEPEALIIDTLRHGSGVGTAILNLIQTHYGSFYTHADTKGGEKLMRRCGMVNVAGHRWRWAKGESPKDMIEESFPFIYDIEGDDKHKAGDIRLGYPGQRTADIPGRFTPGGIVEGYYEPGGKVVMISSTNMPWTVRTFANLWYHMFPQMEIASVELQGPDGKNTKLGAADNVGPYLQTLVQADDAAQNAYRALRYAGGKVYVVGGAVRDAMRGGEPNDLDLMVAGLPPEQVDHVLSKLPGRVDLTGKRFGVYRYKTNGQEVEIALPRQDKYESGRRGEGVITVDHELPIESDLQRRDFTVNSMAVDLDSGQLIDPYGGASDIEKNLLRTTHPDSFREDPTRLVRALVAHSRFGLNPDERTRHEMESNGHMLRGESPDALNKTLDKLFASHNPAGAIRLAHDTGILKHLFPEVEDNFDFDQKNPHHSYPLGEHLLHVLHNTSELTTDPDVRMASLLHDVGKPASAWTDPATGTSHYYQGADGQGANHEQVGARMAEDRMRALNYPTARINRVKHLVSQHMFPAFSSGRGARKFLQRVGDQHADDLLNMRQADMTGKGQTPEEVAARTSVDTQRQLVDEARKQQAPTDLSNLAINGNDLISMGVQPGPQIGNVLRQLLDHVVQTPTDNNRDRLLQLAEGYVNAMPGT